MRRCLAAAALAVASSAAEQLRVEHALGLAGSFVGRELLELEHLTGAAGSRWRLSVSSRDDEAGFQASSTTPGDDFYRLRIGGIATSVKLCVLADAGWKHDLAVTVDAAGALHAVEIRPHVAPGYSGCSASSSFVVPPARDLRAMRYVVNPPEEAVAIPVLPGGKGLPFPGQAELTDTDVLAASGDALDAQARAALEQQLRAAGKGDGSGPGAKEGQPQSFFQKYWHFILLGYVLLMLNKGGGGGGQQEGGGGAGAGGGGQAQAPRAAGAPASGRG